MPSHAFGPGETRTMIFNKRVLLTGGAGFIGSALAARLVDGATKAS